MPEQPAPPIIQGAVRWGPGPGLDHSPARGVGRGLGWARQRVHAAAWVPGPAAGAGTGRRPPLGHRVPRGARAGVGVRLSPPGWPRRCWRRPDCARRVEAPGSPARPPQLRGPAAPGGPAPPPGPGLRAGCGGCASQGSLCLAFQVPLALHRLPSPFPLPKTLHWRVRGGGAGAQRAVRQGNGVHFRVRGRGHLEGPAAEAAASAPGCRAPGLRFACRAGDPSVTRAGFGRRAVLQHAHLSLTSSCCWWSGAGSCSPGAEGGCCAHSRGGWTSGDGPAGRPVTWGVVGDAVRVTNHTWRRPGGPCRRVSPVFHRGVCSVRCGRRPSHVGGPGPLRDAQTVHQCPARCPGPCGLRGPQRAAPEPRGRPPSSAAPSAPCCQLGCLAFPCRRGATSAHSQTSTTRPTSGPLPRGPPLPGVCPRSPGSTFLPWEPPPTPPVRSRAGSRSSLTGLSKEVSTPRFPRSGPPSPSGMLLPPSSAHAHTLLSTKLPRAGVHPTPGTAPPWPEGAPCLQVPEQRRLPWTRTPRRAFRWACAWCAAWTGSGASRTAVRAAWARWWSSAATAAPRPLTARWSCSGTTAPAPTTARATRAHTTCCSTTTPKSVRALDGRGRGTGGARPPPDAAPPPGVRHPNIICDCCKKHGLRGMRWKCCVCADYDLCTQCYLSNKHDLTHAFERYETAHSRP